MSFWDWLKKLFGSRKQRSWFIGVFVRDDKGNPIQDATVNMIEGTALTNAGGWVGFSNVSHQQNHLNITMQGYKPYHVDFFGDTELSGSQQNILVGGIGSGVDISLPPLVKSAPEIVKRQGIVRPANKAVQDDTGFFHPLGMTMMWAYQGWTRDRDRFKKNIEFLRPYGYDFVRVAGHVTWDGWAVNPNDAGYEQTWREIIDYLYDENGLRTEMFLVGDNDRDGIGMFVAEKIARVVKGREHKIMALESTNEGHLNIPDMIAVVKYLRTNTAVPLVALTSPGDVDQLEAAFTESGATVFTVHTERDNPDGRGWRQVRQGRDLMRYPGVVSANEPPGPHSSISSQTDPRVLAMLRANGVISGGAIFVLHVADMVTGLGEAARDRKPNLWEISNIDQILKVVRGVDKLLPQGVENWQPKTSQHGGTDRVGPQPLLSDAIWSDGSDHGVDRAYGAVNGGEFIEVLNGVMNVAHLLPLAPCSVIATDPLTMESISTKLTSQTWDLAGDENASKAYIVNGTFT
jgi:hypothetical protein